MGCLYEPVMVHILVNGHVGKGGKQFVDVIGVVVQVGSDLLVVNVRSIVFMDERKNACHLGICGFGRYDAGAQDLADNGFQQPGTVGLTVVLPVLHFPKYGMQIGQNGGCVWNVERAVQGREVRKGDLFQGSGIAFAFPLQFQGMGDMGKILRIVKIQRQKRKRRVHDQFIYNARRIQYGGILVNRIVGRVDPHRAAAASIIDQTMVQRIGFFSGIRKRVGLDAADKRIALIQSHG